MKRKKIVTLISTIILGLNVASPISAAFANELDASSEFVGDIIESRSYISLQYDGSEQIIPLAEDTQLHLLGWSDETVRKISGIVLTSDADNQVLETEVLIDTNNQRTEYVVNEETSFHISAVKAETFTYQERTSVEIPSEVYKSIESNELGSMKQQLAIIDEFNTILEWKEEYRFVNSEAEEIMEEEYYSVVEEEPDIEEDNDVSVDIPSDNESAEEENLEKIDEKETEIAKKESEPIVEQIEEVQQRSTFSLSRANVTAPSVIYSTHVQNKGWLSDSKDGAISGTSGESKRVEAVKVRIDGIKDLGVSYTTHVQSYGWLNPVSNNNYSGTQGESKRVEAIKINLTGSQAPNYEIYYRVHVEKFGWLGWSKNGEPAGTEGLSRRVEAVEVRLVKKGAPTPTYTQNNFVQAPKVAYTSYVEGIGWQKQVFNRSLSGTEGAQKRIEAVQMGVPSQSGLSLRYSTHLQNTGWTNWTTDNSINGLPAGGKRVEGLKVELTGINANYFDVYYRIHSQKLGWLGWAKNGESAGTEGYGYRAEAYQVEIVPKGTGFNRNGESFIRKDRTGVSYNTHIQNIGWIGTSKNGSVSGTRERALRMEALTVALEHDLYSGNITYSAHVQKKGWITPVSNGAVSGTIGESKRMEAIRINLDGEISKHYDIYYRTYVQTYGWLGWAKNGMSAGTEGLGKRLESIEIKLIEKGSPAPAVTEENAFKQVAKKKVVFLDIGHGGADPGAQYYGSREKDLNLQIGLKVQRDLEKAGYSVIMSRTTDTYMDFKTERSRMANNSGADIFISLHNNAMPGNSSVNGIETYYYQYDPNYQPKINKDMHNDSQRLARSSVLANTIHNNLITYTGAYDRGVRRDTFAVLRETKLPAVLLEFGFMSNSAELQKLKTESYQNTLSKAVTDGVKKYFATY